MHSIKHNHTPQPINGTPSGLKIPKKHPIHKNWLLIIGCSVAAVLLVLVVVAFVWYQIELAPIGGDSGVYKKFTISKNSTSGQVSKMLQDQKIIRNSFVFDIYIKLSGKGALLQAGTYRLSPADSTPDIIDHFTKGSVDKFDITFYPGSTLVDNSSKAEKSKLDVTTVLKRVGYTDTEISTALNKTYTGPLFAGKPEGTSLEGYVYGQTYSIDDGATVEEILQRAFDNYYQVIKDNNFIADFASHGLNLYQGITLASIVQREASGQTDDRQIAQVFYSRLATGMPLGSDVTYQYIADKTGVARDPNLDSLYNTRRYTGLPPGPISIPGLYALKAVANPANTDYLYFLSGDDGITYFAKTNDEHEANITNHCKVKCSTP